MNAAARILLTEGSFRGQTIFYDLASPRNLLLTVLLAIVLANAFAVVYVKDLNRRLFSELQSLQKTHEELNVESGQFLLEQTTWSTQARTQKIAQDNLNMAAPSPQSVVVVKL
jgi:cell division protein FtsL